MIGHFFKTIWTAFRSLCLGLLIGVLVAPRSGRENRTQMRNTLLSLFDTVLPTSPEARDALRDQSVGEQR